MIGDRVYDGYRNQAASSYVTIATNHPNKTSMATTKVMHGRREGQIRGSMAENPISVLPSGVDPREVTVLQPSDWKRIQDVLSQTNHEAMRQQAVKQEREDLHKISKQMVKNWENTIEGQRLKKLQERKIREENEEEQRKLIDIEEAKFQAQKRKEAIERAKTLQYYKTDRVKGFHSAMLLTEVLRERDAQVKMKNNHIDAEKSKDQHLSQLQRKQYEEGVLDDQEKALKRYHERKKISDFQKLQIKERQEQAVKEKELDFAEGENIKQQVEMYEAAKLSIEEQRRQQKLALMESHKKSVMDRQVRLQQEREKEEEEENEIRLFANAKKKMSKMRKEKELELFKAFQDHTEKMRNKLAAQTQQKVDNEDDRIAKAVAEREQKREKDEHAKRQADLSAKNSIHNHRIDMINENERRLKENQDNDRELLKLRVESDNNYRMDQEVKKMKQRENARKLQAFHIEQMAEKERNKKTQVQEGLGVDRENDRLMVEEEVYFQDYAQKVLSEQKAKDPSGNHFPLIKAANEGPGGGRGPRFEGRSGYRPSYLVCDSTGVQLPNCSQENVARSKILGDPGKSFKRLGFNW